MRILLVEDDKELSELIADALKAERYAVDVAYDGQTGWQMAGAYPYDLAILDLMLPALSGTEILLRIRRQNDEVPILILTSPEAVGNPGAGADDYLAKPIAFAELLTRVKSRRLRPSPA